MKVLIKEDAPVLVPNKDHRNFTQTDQVIPGGSVVDGKRIRVEGLYRNKPFTYDLFITDDNKRIYHKYIEPMKTTEINLGADGQKSASVVNLPSVSNLGTKPLIGALAGGLAGLYAAKKHGAQGHKKAAYIIVLGVAGFIAGKYWQSKSAVVVKPSK